MRAQGLSVLVSLAFLAAVSAQEPTVVFKGHEGDVLSVSFLDSGNKAVSADSLGYVYLWDMKEKKQVGRAGGWGKNAVASTAQNGEFLATIHASENDKPYCSLYQPLKALDSNNWFRLLEKQSGSYSVHSVALTTTKDPLLAVCLSYGSDKYGIHVHDAETKKEMVVEGCKSLATTMGFSPDGKLLISGHGDGVVIVWKSDTMKQQGTLTAFEKGAVGCVAIDPKGQTLAVAGGEKTVKLYDLAKLTESEMKLEGHEGAVLAITYSADGKYIATAGKDRTIKIWEASTAKSVASIEAHRNSIRALAFSADNKMLVSGSDDKHVKVWDIEKLLEKK